MPDAPPDTNKEKKTFRISLPLAITVIVAVLLRRVPRAVKIVSTVLVLTPGMIASIALLCIFSIYWSIAAKDSTKAQSPGPFSVC